MAPKRTAAAAQSHAPASTTASTTPAAKTSAKNSQSVPDILNEVWLHYLEHTPQRTKLLDVFMAFLVVVGGLQFVYCVIGGNYPFNAFLAGFCATVGQFVLTGMCSAASTVDREASLRMQTNADNKSYFAQVSPERAFADFVFGSMILHFFCVNFIN